MSKNFYVLGFTPHLFLSLCDGFCQAPNLAVSQSFFKSAPKQEALEITGDKLAL